MYLEVNLFSHYIDFKIHGHESDNNFAHPYIQRRIKSTNVNIVMQKSPRRGLFTYKSYQTFNKAETSAC